MSPNPDRSLGKFRKILPLAVLVAGLGLFFALGLDEKVSFTWLASNYADIKASVASQRLIAWVVFFLLYTVAVAFSLPIASLLTLAGGAVLGWPGFVLVVTAATLGAFILFLAARGAFAEALARKAGPFMTKINDGFNTSPFFWLLALRLIPAFPFWAVNIAPALLGMKTRDYLLATALGIAPGSFVYIWVGRGFDTVLARGEVPDISILADPAILLPLAALGGLALVPVLIQSLRRRKESA